MKAVIQRVKYASVIVNNQMISCINRGICVLIGLGSDDDEEDIEYIVRKLINLRLFEDPDTSKRWDKSVKDLNLEILSVSQFTLHSCIKGNKLDFHRAMKPDKAPKFYAKYMEKLKANYESERVKDGLFGALMQVNIENDGPVTINLDSKRREE